MTDTTTTTTAPGAAPRRRLPRTSFREEPWRWGLLILGIAWAVSLPGQLAYYYSGLGITDPFHLTWIIFYAQFAYVFLGFREIGEEEVAGLILIGYPLEEVSSGLCFTPLGIFRLRKDPMTFFTIEIPAAPQLIYLGKDDVVPEGKFPPIRVTSATREGTKKAFEKKRQAAALAALAGETPATVPAARNIDDDQDPLDTNRITYGVESGVRWKIQQGEYITFLRSFGTREEVHRQFSAIATAFVVEELGQCTVAYALQFLAEINKRLRNKLEEATHESSASTDTADSKARNNWGIALDMAFIKMPSFHHGLNKAIAAPATAKLEGEGEQARLTLEGKGRAAAEGASIDARTEALIRQRDNLNVRGEVALAADTAQRITENPGQKTVITGSGGFGDIIGAAIGIGEVLKNKGGASPATPPSPPRPADSAPSAPPSNTTRGPQ